MKINVKNKLHTLSMVIIAILMLSIIPTQLALGSPALTLRLTMDRYVYYSTESIHINVNLTEDGSPVYQGLVGIQVNNPQGAYILFRTYTVGVPEIPSDINITFAAACDRDGVITNIATPGTLGHFIVTLENKGSTTYEVLLTISVYDKANFLLGSAVWGLGDVPPGDMEILLSIPIPNWAVEGEGKICANAFTDYPENGGKPYCPEMVAPFLIINDVYGVKTTELGTLSGENELGNTLLRLPPDIKSGTYTVEAYGTSLVYETSDKTSFTVEPAEIPPLANFVWSPLYPYTNMSITFDASPSSAGGSGDEITSYIWDFGDGTTATTTDPVYVKSEGYKSPGTYNVTLTVIDTEGLWSTVTKPIEILPPTGPTANFTWSPKEPVANQAVTFDASSTIIGWNGTGPALIVSYIWDFGDGNVTTVSEPTIVHKFTTYGEFNVTLTVIDNQGFSDSITKTITVKEKILGDVNGDGKVDLSDLVAVGLAYGSQPGDPNWNPDADLNNDGTVGLQDLVTVALHYGESI